VYADPEGGLVVSPTDLTNFLECRHLTRLDLSAALGEIPVPSRDDDTLDLLRERGLEHERAYLAQLRTERHSVAEISASDVRQAERDTVEAMRSGVDIVYQAALFDGVWRGHADFLERRSDRPSLLGSWSYDIVDTKLARRLTVPALLQMAIYAGRLRVLQGRPPEWLTVVTGDGVRRPFRLEDCAAYVRRLRRDFLAALEAGQATYPEKVRHCSRCRWDPMCSERRRADDHLSSVAGMRRDQGRQLAGERHPHPGRAGSLRPGEPSDGTGARDPAAPGRAGAAAGGAAGDRDAAVRAAPRGATPRARATAGAEPRRPVP